jgi:hypothetical protein
LNWRSIPEIYQSITQHQRDISNFSILNFIVHVLDFWFLQSRNPRFDMQWPLIKLIGRFVKHARSSTVHLFKCWGYQKSADTRGMPQNQKPFCSVLIPNVTEYMAGSPFGALPRVLWIAPPIPIYLPSRTKWSRLVCLE